MRLETMLFCGNHSRYWLPHLELNEVHISFQNLGQIFHELCSRARREFHVWLLSKSQEWLDTINEWTVNQKMMLNTNKTKTMIFNYTDNFQFMTRLRVENEPIEVIDSTKLLGTIISKDLTWDLNTASLIKKANARMQLLRKVASFSTPTDDLKEIYILFIRSILEHSATVWHSSLTQENIDDLERVQNSGLRIILQEKYKSYKQGLALLNLETLAD
jgi:hypothetical protein